MTIDLKKNEIEEIVDRQLNAYNQGDYETFKSCYHEDISSYEFESSKMIVEMCGENFFSHYQRKFLENPNIHCEVTERIVHDNLVVDKEIISDYRSQKHRELVVYQIENNLILKMWFSKEIAEVV